MKTFYERLLVVIVIGLVAAAIVFFCSIQPATYKASLSDLVAAVRSGTEQDVMAVLASGVDPLREDSDGNTLLNVLATYRSAKPIRKAVEFGADVNMPNSSGWTPLMIAVKWGNEPVVSFLLNVKGISLDIKNQMGWDARDICGFYERKSVATILGINIEEKIRCYRLQKKLLAAASTFRATKEPFLLDPGRYEYDVVESPEELCEQGAQPNFACPHGHTAVMFAANCGDSLTLRLLVGRGASVDKRDERGRRALHFACQHGHQECVRVLLQGGADVDQPDNSGESPLMTSAFHGHCEVLRLLLDRGAHVDSPSVEGKTALFFSVAGRKRDACQLLLERGADISVKDRYGNTAAGVAKEYGFSWP